MNTTPESSSHDLSYWVRSGLFASVHGFALLCLVLFQPTPERLILAAGVYSLLMFSITIGYHRYFSHRSFKTSRWLQFVIAWLAQTSTQKGVLWWAAHHRRHHRSSDQPEDPHSPKRGFWWSHVGWILDEHSEGREDKLIPDLLKFPELRWLDRWYLLPPTVLAVALWCWGGWSYVGWGYVIPTVVVWHATYTINSLNHVWGARVYETTDTSRNNPILALLTFGEGWHNNHHYYQISARQGFLWWEYDLSYYVLRTAELVGLIRDVKRPTDRVLAARGVWSKAGDLLSNANTGVGYAEQAWARAQTATEVARGWAEAISELPSDAKIRGAAAFAQAQRAADQAYGRAVEAAHNAEMWFEEAQNRATEMRTSMSKQVDAAYQAASDAVERAKERAESAAHAAEEAAERAAEAFEELSSPLPQPV